MTERERPVHWCLGNLTVADDELIFAGRTVSEIAAEIGRTPFYAYDSIAMTERVESLKRQLPDAVHLHYAMKANPMLGLVMHMAELVDGLDVASGGELEVALKTSTPPDRISFAGPGKSTGELARAIEAGIVINMESEREMDRIATLAEQLGADPAVAIRVNPDFELKTSGMKMGGGPQQFGVDAELVPGLLRRVGELGLSFHGFHIFSGSQNLSSDAISETQEKSVELALKLADAAPGPVRQLNIGGGFGIPYFPSDLPLDVGPIADNLQSLLAKVERRLPEARLIIELGRYLVGEAGIYVCRVVDRKLSRGRVFLVTNGGLHHHLAASGNFGQVLRRNYPVCVGNKVRGAEREIVSVVGPLCTPLDLLADKMEMSRADVGDLIVVMMSGAYGLTASPTAFLSHPPPAEVLL